jgi:hypothetical protein
MPVVKQLLVRFSHSSQKQRRFFQTFVAPLQLSSTQSQQFRSRLCTFPVKNLPGRVGNLNWQHRIASVVESVG